MIVRTAGAGGSAGISFAGCEVTSGVLSDRGELSSGRLTAVTLGEPGNGVASQVSSEAEGGECHAW
jgi:hypothetical protein